MGVVYGFSSLTFGVRAELSEFDVFSFLKRRILTKIISISSRVSPVRTVSNKTVRIVVGKSMGKNGFTKNVSLTFRIDRIG